MAAPAARTPAERRGTNQNKWNNWQSAVAAGRSDLHSQNAQRESRLRGLESATTDPQSVVDSTAAASKIASHENGAVRASFERYGRWTTDSFTSLKTLGEGAFGVVHLVRHKSTGELFALKQMEKARYQQKNRGRAFSERDALAEARSRWCVELLATFLDEGHVYMVMEFVQGGDLIGHLQRKGRFSEDETVFYMAELLEALDTVHKCGFVHRDVKPDNVVITVSGHLKLLDFGLCKAGPSSDGTDDISSLRGSVQARSTPAVGGTGGGNTAGPARVPSIVGTPQYMSPEGFSGEYGPESDLWAIGIIGFECLAGVVPFHAGRREGPEAIRMIKEKILYHAEILPERLRKTRRYGWTTPTSERFLTGIICPREQRLTAAQIRQEPFFASVDFTRLHLQQPPFVPEVSSPEDTSLFEGFGQPSTLPGAGPRIDWDKNLEWANYAADGRALAAQKARHVLLDSDEEEGATTR
mmetsp:Transcript_2368/g.5908  ORF Transcript_2368/g.5908 Transcript_2368/m.5908 type:complete len:470 (-) Transcript_2368:133-1542(-)